jgi:gamma-glutamylcyclotransferase (GGCT)/AIG2-like uncharacterized protein YtfP
MGERKRRTGSHEVVDRLFVYGTLREGETARSLVASSIKRSMRAHTSGQIYAFPMGYPGFIEGDTGKVVGEIIWIVDLAATLGLLDAYEGDDFARVIRLVTTETGEELWAWIYTLVDPSLVIAGARIEHGDWVKYRTERLS